MEDEDLFVDSDEDAPGTSAAKKPSQQKAAAAPDDKKMMFRREIKAMLYGFGDDKEPYDKTIEVVENIVLDYIKELCEKALNVGKPDKILLEDIHYLIRRDAKKFARVKDLLSMSEELKKARKDFEDAKGPD